MPSPHPQLLAHRIHRALTQAATLDANIQWVLTALAAGSVPPLGRRWQRSRRETVTGVAAWGVQCRESLSLRIVITCNIGKFECSLGCAVCKASASAMAAQVVLAMIVHVR